MLRTALRAGLLLAATLLVTACPWRVPVYDLGKPLTLRGHALASAVEAIETGELDVSATLRGGRFRIAALEKSLDAVTVRDGTELRGVVAFELLREASGAVPPRVVPRVTKLELTLSKPLTVEPHKARPLRVSVLSASAREGSLVAATDVGRTLGATLVGLVLGLGDVSPPDGDVASLVKTARVSKVRLALREQARLTLGESVLVVGAGSWLRLEDGQFDPRTGAAAASFSLALRLAEGSCVSAGPGTRVCPQSGDFDLSGRASRSAKAVETLVEGGPARLTLQGGAARVAGNELSLGAVSAELTRFRCEFPDGNPQCALDAEFSATLGPGRLSLGGRQLAFTGLALKSARLSTSGTGSAVAVRDLTLERPTLTALGADGPAGGAAWELAFETLELRHLTGVAFGALRTADALVRVGPGTATLPVGGARVRAVLPSGAELAFHSAGRAGEAGGATRDAGPAGLLLSLAPEDGPPPALELAFTAGAVELVVGDDEVVVSAEALHVAAELRGAARVVTLTADAPLELGGSALVRRQVGGAELAFSLLRLATDEQGGARLTARDLSVTVPKAPVLAALREKLPATHESPELPLSNDAAKALAQAGSPLDWGRLSRFRTQYSVAGLDQLELALDGERIRVSGSPRGTFRVLANKRHVRTTMCRRERKVPYPCFMHGKPKMCEKTISYDEPCIETSESDEDVFNLSTLVELSVDAELTSNAPSPLDAFELTLGITNCNRLDVHGLADLLEHLFDVRDAICDKLRAKRKSIRVGDALGPGATFFLKNASVAAFRLGATEEALTVALSLDVALPGRGARSDATPPPAP